MAAFLTVWLAFVAQEVRVELRAEAAVRWIDGDVRFDERPARGDRLDARGDLGWTEASVVPSLGVAVSLDRHVLDASYQSTRFRGTAFFSQPKQWNETFFPPGRQIRTRFYFEEADLDYRFKVVDGMPLRLEAGVSGRYVRITMKMDADDDHMGLFIPELAARAAWAFLPGLEAEARVSGTAFSVTGLRARTATLRLGLQWAFAPTASVGVAFDAALFHVISRGGIQRNEIDLRGISPGLSFELSF